MTQHSKVGLTEEQKKTLRAFTVALGVENAAYVEVYIEQLLAEARAEGEKSGKKVALEAVAINSRIIEDGLSLVRVEANLSKKYLKNSGIVIRNGTFYFEVMESKLTSDKEGETV